MKKEVGKFLFTITALLCFFAMSGHSSIISKAADNTSVPGTLLEGSKFNKAILNLGNGTTTTIGFEPNSSIKKVVFLDKNLTAQQKASLEKQKKVSVGTDVYAYYGSGILSVYSPADKIIFDKYCWGMFRGLEGVTQFDFGKNRIDTSHVYDMGKMFYDCRSLKQIDLGAFDTSNVDELEGIFEFCDSLEGVNMHILDLSMVSDMSRAFMGCSNLKEMDFSNMDVEVLQNLESMFWGCSSLKKVDFRGFKTGRINQLQYMFAGCYELESVDISSFDGSDVANTTNMFSDCKLLKRVDLSSINTTELTYMSGMFYGCQSLEYVDIRNLELSGVYESESAFDECASLKTIIAPKATRQIIDFPNLMVIDNDYDGVADTAETFHKNPISGRVNRLIAYADVLTASGKKVASDGSEIIVESGGITYKISIDGTATVTKINASGKVSIDTLTYNGATYPVKTIAASACKNNKQISALTIGKNVTSIEKDAFKGCKKLKKITIKADKNLKIGKGAFKKISKKAVISVKGIKGTQKKKIVKAIKKQTNAKVG